MARGWRVAGGSVTGPAHLSEGSDCQDRHRVQVTRGGVLIAAVSDGAGSAAHGGEGAALICDHVVDGLAKHFARPRATALTRAALLGACRAVHAAVESARAAGTALAAGNGAGLSAYHATLVGAVMAPGKGGLFFHIGDGAALALDAAQGRWVLSAPRNGEYANTTYFFTEEDWRRQLRFKLVEPGHDTLFLMSDGVTELALTQRGCATEPFMPFFDPIGRFLASASREDGEAALLATLDSGPLRERTGDDKTLLWAQAL